MAWCAQSKNKAVRLFNASAIGIYGLQLATEKLPDPMVESSAIPDQDASDFLSEVGMAWEAAATPLIDKGFPVTFLRFAVVLKRREGMLKQLEIPFSLGFGTTLGTGLQAVSWIDIDDLVSAILFLLARVDQTGAFNLCSPHCINQREFAKTLANVLHRPQFLNLPAPIVKLLFGEMGEELLLGGQHVYPERLLQLGFQFTYPDLTSALLHQWQT